MTDRKIPILVTEHKAETPDQVGMGTVRVFVDNDLHYGLFIDEVVLLGLLTEAQRVEYFSSDSPEIYVEKAVAQRVIDEGLSPYSKPTL